MTQPTSPVSPGEYTTDVDLTTPGATYTSEDGAGFTTIVGTGTNATDAAVLVTAGSVTLGGPDAGFQIIQGASEPVAVWLAANASGGLVEGNTIDGNGAYSGPGYDGYYDTASLLVAAGDDNVTIGGTATGDGNTFGGSGGPVVIEGLIAGLFQQGSATTNVDIEGNTFDALSFLQLQDDASSGTISGNTFVGTIIPVNEGDYGTVDVATSAISLGLLPKTVAGLDNSLFPTVYNYALVNPGSVSIVDNTFTNVTGADISDFLAYYNFANGAPAQHSFTGVVNNNGQETDTLLGYQAGDHVQIDAQEGYSVAAVHQDGPDQVDVFLQFTPPFTQGATTSLTGDEIVLQNLTGVSVTQVASMLVASSPTPIQAPIADGPVANNGTELVGPSQSLDITTFVDSLWGPGSGAGDDPTPQLIAVSPMSPSGAGTVNYNAGNGDINILTPPNGATGVFTYTVEDKYGDLAQGTVTVDTDGGPTASEAFTVVGHSQTSVDLTSQIFQYVTAGQPDEHDVITAVNTTSEDTAGTVVLNDGDVTYTPKQPGAPGYSGYDYFGYTVTDKYGQTSSNVVYVSIDPGPTAGTINATVSATPSTPTNLASLILQGVTPGLPHDIDTITGVGTVNTLGMVVLSNGTVDYTATGTTPQNESKILDQIATKGSATDSFTYTVQDQNGDAATGTVDLVLKPLILNEPPGNGNIISGTEPTQLIRAPAVDDTIDLNGYNDVVQASSEDHVNIGSGDAYVNLEGGSFDIVHGGDGWITVTNATDYNTIDLGSGPDTVNIAADYNTISLGNGNDDVTVGGGGNTVTLGSGTDTLSMGTGSFGQDTFTLNGSDAHVYLHGSNNMVFVNGGADFISDSPLPPNGPGDKLTLTIGASGGEVTLVDFSDAHGVIDIAHQLIDGGALGAAPSAAQVAGYMNSHGGLLPFVHNLGSLDITSPSGGLSASNFHIF